MKEGEEKMESQEKIMEATLRSLGIIGEITRAIQIPDMRMEHFLTQPAYPEKARKTRIAASVETGYSPWRG